MLASYAGHIKHGAANGSLGQSCGQSIAGWGRFRAARVGVCRALVETLLCYRARSFHAQYWRLARRAGNDSLVFFRVGRFIEFYGPQRFLAVRT